MTVQIYNTRKINYKLTVRSHQQLEVSFSATYAPLCINDTHAFEKQYVKPPSMITMELSTLLSQNKKSHIF
jgi:hypothetical protein